MDSRHSYPRRNFLAGAAALGWSALARPHLHAQAKPQRIDIHHHLFPPNYRSAIASAGGGNLAAWTAEQSIAEMDKSGIQTSVISVSPPGVWFGDAAQSRNLARIINDYGAKMRGDFPGRFGLFAATDGAFPKLHFPRPQAGNGEVYRPFFKLPLGKIAARRANRDLKMRSFLSKFGVKARHDDHFKKITI